MGNFVQGELGKQIWQLFDEGTAVYQHGDKGKSIRILESIWDLLPDDKNKYDEGYLALHAIVDTAIEINDLETLKKWKEKIFVAGEGYEDFGERDLMAGKIAFEIGEKKEALYYLRQANEKSQGRCFGDGDKKYKQLLQDESFNELD